jgi:hypothetical protein
MFFLVIALVSFTDGLVSVGCILRDRSIVQVLMSLSVLPLCAMSLQISWLMARGAWPTLYPVLLLVVVQLIVVAQVILMLKRT